MAWSRSYSASTWSGEYSISHAISYARAWSLPWQILDSSPTQSVYQGLILGVPRETGLEIH